MKNVQGEPKLREFSNGFLTKLQVEDKENAPREIPVDFLIKLKHKLKKMLQ